MSIFSKIKKMFSKQPENKKDEPDLQRQFDSMIEDMLSGKQKNKSPLAPCPFCGGGVSAMTNYEVADTMFVICNTCQTAFFFSNNPRTIAEIKLNWNHRAGEATLRAEITRLKKGE